MLKRLLVVTLVLVFVAGLSGLVYAFDENESTIQQVGNTNFVGLVHQTSNQGNDNTSTIKQTSSWNRVWAVFQFNEASAGASFDNVSIIHQTGTVGLGDNCVFVVWQEGDGVDSLNKSEIYQQQYSNTVYGVYQGAYDDDCSNLSKITQSGNSNTVGLVMQLIP